MPDEDPLNLRKIFWEVLKAEGRRQAKFLVMAIVTSSLLMIPILIRDSNAGWQVIAIAWGFLLFFHWSLIVIFSTMLSQK